MLECATALTYSDKTEILPGLWATAIRNPHDCPGTVGFKIETADTIVGYITDLGMIPESTMEELFGADCIVIESNYDDAMLRYGRYPAFLKKRILSDRGHLSNDACSAALARFADRGTKHFFLAHLSQENNRPELALDCAEKACAGINVQIKVLPVLGKQLITVRN